MNLKDKIDLDRIPQHIAIIMDGNGRWAEGLGKARVYGHTAGVESVRSMTEECSQLGVKYLTLYAFSTENWKRPDTEVTALMELLVRTLRKETTELNQNNVKISVIGNVEALPDVCYKELQESINLTADNDGLNLILALSYSGRWEITDMVKRLAEEVQKGNLSPSDIDEKLVGQSLSTQDVPDPELLIRTSGEFRLSNFLLWQNAYTEMYFTSTLWPDFREEELHKALIDFQSRERRFGKTSKQIQA